MASLLALVVGSITAARLYPGGFDWLYTVASALASQKDNPAGRVWFAGGLGLSMVLLWPYVSVLKKTLNPPLSPAVYFAIIALRVGVVCGALLSLEGLLIRDLSQWVHKGHEILAIFTFLGLFFGILGFLVPTMLRQRIYAVPVLLVAIPLLAISISQFWLYLDQRSIGWVGTDWRELGIPLWLSFAFWQWLAIAFLELGMGLLMFTSTEENNNN